MEYIGIEICVIVVVAIAEKHAIAVSDDAPTELTIEMEMLPAEVIKDENALVEITDSKVLAHVNRFFE